MHEEIPGYCFGTEMKKVCKCAWPSDFKGTEYESGAKGRRVTLAEKIQRHLQMAKAGEQDFSEAGAV